MEKWEYLPKFIQADASDKTMRQYVKANAPKTDSKKKPPRYTPEAMMPELNELGDQGWELVHMEPVANVGNKGDVLFEGNMRQWSNTYFCVFKRRRTDSSDEVGTSSGASSSAGNDPLPPDLSDS